MYEISVCKEPAVPLALITEFNQLAKSMKAENMCGMNWDELDNDKIRVKCDGLKCYVIRDDTDEVLKSWEGDDIEVVTLGTNSETLKSSQEPKLDNNMSKEDKIIKEEDKKEEDDKKEEKADNGNNDKKEEPKKDEEKSTVGKQDYKFN